MPRKRRRKVEPSLIEKQEDAMAKLALYRDEVHHGKMGWDAQTLRRVIATGTVIVVVLYVLYSFSGFIVR